MADADGEPARARRGRAPRTRQAALPDTPDPIDIAMEQVNAGGGGPAALLLANQNRLVEAQIHELHLKRVTRFIVLSLILALLVAALALVVEASRTNSLIVEPLQVPPALAQNGLTGEAVASRLLDRLKIMQKAGTSARAANDYSNAWTGDIKVVVPQADVSVGDVWRLMLVWLGHETRITGEIVRTPAGLAVTVRAGSHPAERFEGPEMAIEDLLQKSAESVFRDTQPYRYASYLLSAGRAPEYEQVLRGLTDDESPVERKWAYVGLCGHRRREGRFREAVEMADRALAIDPHMTQALGNKASALLSLGHYEEALQNFRATAESRRRRRPKDFDRRRYAEDRREDAGNIGALSGDFATLIQLARPEAESLPTEERRRSGGSNLSYVLAYNHDVSGALAAARNIVGLRSANTPEQAALADAFRRVRPFMVLRDSERTRAEIPDTLRTFQRVLAAEAVRPNPQVSAARPQLFFPELVVALAIAGDRIGAARLAAQMPADCYPCLSARGRIAALGGDREVAHRLFAEAVRQGPSLPFAYSDLGELKLEAGDLKGAIDAFRAANQRGPRWADPLKYWGDALARQGDHVGAARKYAAAAERAPRWGALHVEWGKVLWWTGRHEEARAKFRAAARMDLNGPDRTRLQRIWAGLRGRT